MLTDATELIPADGGRQGEGGREGGKTKTRYCIGLHYEEQCKVREVAAPTCLTTMTR